jgi:hypothetical protein
MQEGLDCKSEIPHLRSIESRPWVLALRLLVPEDRCNDVMLGREVELGQDTVFEQVRGARKTRLWQSW